MKTGNYLQLMVYGALVIGFVLLWDPLLFGIRWHEPIGLMMAGVVAIHLVLSGKGVKVLLTKMLSEKVDSAKRVRAIIDSLLVIWAVLIFISGISISVTLLTGITLGNRPFWVEVHKIATYGTMGLAFIHIMFHRDWFKLWVRKQKK